MYFSPAYLSSLIVEPLRFLFSRYGDANVTWDPDPKVSSIEITTVNNYNQLIVQKKPRILVGRGQYSINPTGLSDNMAQAKSTSEMFGLRKEVRMTLINGVSQIMIEAYNEGTAEKIVDMASHFLAWSAPLIAETQGFKIFGMPLNVSSLVPSKEDKELFQCTINIPWTKEEHWIVANDGIELKQFLLTIVQNSN